jgi:hypothetical protein
MERTMRIYAHPMQPLLEEEAIAFGGTSEEDLLNLLMVHMSADGPHQRLLALVIANPRDPFGDNDIFGLMPYWHHRSAEKLLFILPGYKVTETFASGRRPEFDEQQFARFLDWLEGNTTIEYRSQAIVLLVVATRHRNNGRWSLDWTSVFQMNVEELLNQGLIPNVKTVFEALILLAKRHRAADDVMVELKDALKGFSVEANLGTALASIFRLDKTADAAVKIARANMHFRISDVSKRQEYT